MNPFRKRSALFCQAKIFIFKFFFNKSFIRFSKFSTFSKNFQKFRLKTILSQSVLLIMLKIKPLDHQMQVQYKLVMQVLYMHSHAIMNMKMNQAVFVVGTFLGCQQKGCPQLGCQQLRTTHVTLQRKPSLRTKAVILVWF